MCVFPGKPAETLPGHEEETQTQTGEAGIYAEGLAMEDSRCTSEGITDIFYPVDFKDNPC